MEKVHANKKIICMISMARDVWVYGLHERRIIENEARWETFQFLNNSTWMVWEGWKGIRRWYASIPQRRPMERWNDLVVQRGKRMGWSSSRNSAIGDEYALTSCIIKSHSHMSQFVVGWNGKSQILYWEQPRLIEKWEDFQQYHSSTDFFKSG